MGNNDFEKLFESDEERAANAPNTQIDEPTIEPIAEEPIKKKKWGKCKRFFLWVLLIAVLTGAIWVYMYYFNPYVVEAQKSGYISVVEKKGVFFKTFEGELIERVGDDNDPDEFEFSFETDSLALVAMDIQGTGDRVKIKYRKYNGSIPWRGSSQYIVFDIQKP